ncbi:MAG: class I SAM-dependent methyltransferase [Planctomycetota bacterium]|nr:class I SAM-dependent methyltransferase [Planctomycetota bacterium]
MSHVAGNASRPDGAVAIKVKVLEAVFVDLGLAPLKVRTLDVGDATPPSPGTSALYGIAKETQDCVKLAPQILNFARAHVADNGALVVFAVGERTNVELASLRNALWPAFHVVALYKTSDTQITRVALDGARDLGRSSGMRGTALVARPIAAVFAPEVTVAKFDKNAAGWNRSTGERGSRHFRWMRRYVAEFAGDVPRERVLDFGCGAGWVGIEACLHTKSRPTLAAFDPSPEMVRIAGENAAANGLAGRFIGRTGFGEDPPFPAGNEPLFDLVLSSGVVSFSGELARWYDGLVRTLAPGGTLVIGDIHRDSIGMRERRVTRPLLPVREMNAQVREDARAELEKRGLRFDAWCGYQLSRPLPQLLHVSETRLFGALDPLLVWWNDRASKQELARGSREPDRFDSWVMRMRRVK